MLTPFTPFSAYFIDMLTLFSPLLIAPCHIYQRFVVYTALFSLLSHTPACRHAAIFARLLRFMLCFHHKIFTMICHDIVVAMMLPAVFVYAAIIFHYGDIFAIFMPYFVIITITPLRHCHCYIILSYYIYGVNTIVTLFTLLPPRLQCYGINTPRLKKYIDVFAAFGCLSAAVDIIAASYATVRFAVITPSVFVSCFVITL